MHGSQEDRVAKRSIHAHLKTTPITPQAALALQSHRFGKNPRTIGDPVAAPKPTPRFLIPPPLTRSNLALPLSAILPQEAATVQSAGELVFHTVGDTGGVYGDNVQKAVADAMEAQRVAVANTPSAPAFLYNLGDVVYFNGLSTLYPSQFYEPYQDYHAAILAIAGNHDGDTQTRPGDPADTEPSLLGFMRNFCDAVSHPDSAYRPTMTQPYVYWVLDAGFLRIVGLYSNVDGNLDARGTAEQQQWLTAQLATAPADVCLIVAVHHPPYSLDTVHRGYPDIEVALDSAIHSTNRVPDAVLSGHVHSYQRFQRTIGTKSVPYVVAGAGGYANTPKLLHQIEKQANGRPLPPGFQTTHPDLKLMAFNDSDAGFLRISVNGKKRTLALEYFVVPFQGAPTGTAADHALIKW
jgi:hypothetical protein